MSSFDRQVEGSHYDLPIQPITYCLENDLGYLESTAIKYVSRWRRKGGTRDLDKAIHVLEMLKEHAEDNPARYGLDT